MTFHKHIKVNRPKKTLTEQCNQITENINNTQGPQGLSYRNLIFSQNWRENNFRLFGRIIYLDFIWSMMKDIENVLRNAFINFLEILTFHYLKCELWTAQNEIRNFYFFDRHTIPCITITAKTARKCIHVSVRRYSTW